jgi:hypothetical protein
VFKITRNLPVPFRAHHVIELSDEVSEDDCAVAGHGASILAPFGRRLFTPLFTPARFSRSDPARIFQQTIAPQAQLQLTAELCPLYPRKRTCAVH